MIVTPEAHDDAYTRNKAYNRVRQFYARDVYGILGSEAHLTREQQRVHREEMYERWRQLKSRNKRSTEYREQLRQQLLAARHLVYEGADGLAAQQARYILSIVEPPATHFDFRVYLHSLEILRDVGVPWNAESTGIMERKGIRVLQGWILERSKTGQIVSLAQLAHIHRSNGTVDPSSREIEYWRAKKLIKAAAELLITADGAGLACLGEQVPFQKLRIGVESRESELAGEAIKEIEDVTDHNDPRSRLDYLRAKISFDLFCGHRTEVDESLQHAWAAYNSLDRRSPYTYFSIKYREIAAFEKRPFAARDSVKEYIDHLNQPNRRQAFCYSRLLQLWKRPLPVRINRPEVYAIRTSLFYLYDELVDL